MAKQLFKIKHWKIVHGSYEDLPNTKATWFIDPPYQFGGHAYMENKINFESLALWCKERTGQVIVCENSKATWLPFNTMTKFRGAMNTNTESIWTNEPNNYQHTQLTFL